MTRKFELSKSAKADMRTREAEVMRKRLHAACGMVRALDAAWGLWADAVRQVVDERHGVAYPVAIEEAHKVLWDDPEYGGALDLGRSIDHAKAALQRMLEGFNELEPGP
jgi:hypothetical protein